MASKIDVTGIDENFPVPGINQSTAKFRSNAASIKNNLKISHKEITDLQGKLIEIQGDATGVSGIMGEGANQPQPIQLTLRDSGVTAGVYHSDSHVLSFTVDNKGRLTAAAMTAIPELPSAGTHGAVLTNVDGSNGSQEQPAATTSITLPKFTVDSRGRVTAVEQQTLRGFGLNGQPLAKGSLFVGNSDNVISTIASPEGGFRAGDVWALTWNPLLSASNSLTWSRIVIPTMPTIPEYTPTTVTAGAGIAVLQEDHNYQVDLNLNGLPQLEVEAPLDGAFEFVAVNGDTTFRTSLSKLVELVDASSTIETPQGITEVKQDTKPQLGGDLDTNGFVLTTSKGNLHLTAPSGKIHLDGFLLLQDQQWPTVPATEGQVLAVGASGDLVWVNRMATITGSTGVTVTRTADAVSAQLDYNGLPFSNTASGYVAVQTAGGDMVKTLISGGVRPFGTFVSETGSDTSGDGSFDNPYQSVLMGMSKRTSSSVVLLPGTYAADFAISSSGVQVVGWGNPSDVKLVGSMEIMPGLKRTRLENITISVRNNLPDDSGNRGLFADNGVDSLIVKNCVITQERTADDTQPVLELRGVKNGHVAFLNCEINGKIVNLLEDNGYVGDSGYVNSEGVTTVPAIEMGDDSVLFNNITSARRDLMTVQVGAGSSTKINNVNALGLITHTGGTLSVSNVDYWYGDGITALQSSAPASASNFVRLHNVNTMVVFSKDGTAGSTRGFTAIRKTGTCDYHFTQVVSKSSQDTVNGSSFG